MCEIDEFLEASAMQRQIQHVGRPGLVASNRTPYDILDRLHVSGIDNPDCTRSRMLARQKTQYDQLVRYANQQSLVRTLCDVAHVLHG